METGWRWTVLRRPFTGRRLEWKGSLVRPGSSGQIVFGGAAAQHSVQPTGEDLGRLTMLTAPAADGWRWAELLRGYPQAGGWNGSLVC